MQSSDSPSPNTWDEHNTQTFVDYGRYFIPEREHQLHIIAGLLPRRIASVAILELCCGEGILAQTILERYPGASIYGLDGSTGMLKRAIQRLAPYGERFQARQFNLADLAWRDDYTHLNAVVSSLAIHHLDGSQKQALFKDVYRMLAPGGALIIADVIEPAHPRGWELAADEWDAAVRQRAIQLDDSLVGFEFFSREHWNMYRYFDPEDIDKPSPLFDQLKWLEQAGFYGIDVFWMSAGHAIYGGFKR
jgi:tRNA (cmo5U34)-methyltransferase